MKICQVKWNSRKKALSFRGHFSITDLHMFSQSFLVWKITVFQIGVAQRKFEKFANWGGVKPSSVLKYSGWGIVDSPSESLRQTAVFFLFFFSIWISFYSFKAHMYMATIIMVCCSCNVIMFQICRFLHDQGPYKMQNIIVPWCLIRNLLKWIQTRVTI